jgi:sugar/nucleoside kinase (ribokinase family)
MSLVVVGSVALDSVRTPFGAREDALGGSAYYFAMAAAFFTKVHVVGVVGDDFPAEHVAFLDARGIDTRGLTRAPGRTFRWAGEYGDALNEARTLDTRLGVFQEFHPVLPDDYRALPNVFLANIDPDLQREVLAQVAAPRLVACDTMNFWITGKPDALKRTLARVDVLVVNDIEARLFSGETNLVRAARFIMGLGPRTVVIKRGEYGALLFDGEGVFAVPAFPLETVADPTGAGDSFAGGFVGYLSRVGTRTDDDLRRAMVHGSVMASFNVEDFSVDRLRTLTLPEIDARARAFAELTRFELGEGGA